MRTAGMNSVSCIDASPSPPSLSNVQTPGTSKSKVRSLFHWRRPSTGSLRPNTRAGHEPVPSLPSSVVQVPRPALDPRSYSDHSHLPDRPRSADNKLSRKRDRIVTDPPPLAQAYGQALLHAELETPTSFTDKGRYGIHVAKDLHAGCLLDDTVEVKRSHKKTESGGSTCSTQGKIFFLVNGPYVLQYDGDSNGDALPEKILILDRNSVAIACDAVPGRPWVLQISKPYLIAAKGHGQSLRPSWSKMTLRQPEDRRTVNTLLLVFNDSEELYTWLFAMRKEIENLGGLEYRPDGEDDQAWRENLSQKFGSASVSHKSSIARTTSTRASPGPLGGGGPGNLARIIPNSNRSSTSSKLTSTSLDRFRDSIASDGYTSTLATSCADGSASSPSPIYETFPSIKSVTEHTNGDLSLRSYVRSNEASPRLSTSPKPSRSILERRKLSVSSLNLAGQEESRDRGRKFFLDLPSTISASPDEPPKETGSAIDDTADTKDPASVKSDTENNKHQRTNSSKRHVVRQPSAAGSASSGRKPKYSLFPTCPPAEIKSEPLVDPSTFLQPLVIPKIIESHHDSKSRTYPGTEVKHQKSGSRVVTLELRQHRVSALLGAGEFSQAQRSPAATDDMIMSNFGIVRSEPPASPMPEIRVPGLSDLGFDMDFLRTPYRAPSKNHSPTSRDRRTSSGRSVSSSRHEASTTLAKAPAGPPPAGPLPAPPPEGRRSFQTNRSSHQSHRSQRSQTRKSDQHIVEDVQAHEQILYSTQLSLSPKSAKPIEGRERYRRRTKSNSANGPALHNTPCGINYEPASHSRSRSHSRGRQRSGKNI